MRKLGLFVVVVSMVAVSVAAADEMKKKEAPKAAPPPAADKAAKAEPAAPAAPAPVMPTEPPKPGPEMDAMKGFGMTWKCTGTEKDPATGADVAYTSVWKGKLDLNKLWYSIEYKKTVKKPKMVFTGHGFVGWSAADKAYLFSGMDDWGGYIALTSAGWSGKTLAFAGMAGGPMGKAGFRITFAQNDDGKGGTVTMEAQMGKDWMQVSTETCKK